MGDLGKWGAGDGTVIHEEDRGRSEVPEVSALGWMSPSPVAGALRDTGSVVTLTMFVTVYYSLPFFIAVFVFPLFFLPFVF